MHRKFQIGDLVRLKQNCLYLGLELQHLPPFKIIEGSNNPFLYLIEGIFWKSDGVPFKAYESEIELVDNIDCWSDLLVVEI